NPDCCGAHYLAERSTNGSVAHPALSQADVAIDLSYLGGYAARGRKNCGRKMVEQDERYAPGCRERFDSKSTAFEGRLQDWICGGRQDICRSRSCNCARGWRSHLRPQPVHLAEPCSDWAGRGLVRRVPCGPDAGWRS